MDGVAPRLSQIKSIQHEDLWAKQIRYWRTHLDIFIEEYFKVKLKDVQKIQARAFGNCETLVFVQSRGFGKTWITALCCLALGVLYPNSPIMVASGTFDQASLVLRKIQSEFLQNENIYREIKLTGLRAAIRKVDNSWRLDLKNGSSITCRTLGTMRGNRAKIVVIDEAPEVQREVVDAVVGPLRNYKRSMMTQMDLKDYDSKIIFITSACLKSNSFYDQFVGSLKEMSMGDQRTFACALDYHAAIRAGITDESFFEKEKRRMPESIFAMEYESIFVGAEAGAVFPYELTARARKLTEVETAMPAKSTSDYILSIDLATSSASTADNAVFSVFKLAECEDGTFIKKLVMMRSFHGKRLDYLSAETRKFLIKFPRIVKVVFDHRGLGDAFPRFFSQPWVDPETSKEYPPLVLDTEPTSIRDAVPLLHPVVATSAVNQQLVSALSVALEQGSIELPIESRHIINNHVVFDEDEPEDERRKYTLQEKAIFEETDALQIEMGNIVGKMGASGAILYDVAKHNQHKDRYSSVAMGVWYISLLEDDRRKKLLRNLDNACVGIVLHF